MMRRMIRDGIRSIEQGNDPVGVFRDPPPDPIPTYGYETSAKVPPRPPPRKKTKNSSKRLA